MRKQILLVCDDFPFCRNLREAMQDDTTDIQYFLTASDALDHFMRRQYCLVIMDSHLKNIDSRNLLRVMHQSKPVPVLVLADVLSVEAEIEFFSLGATVCVSRPGELTHFIAQVQALIRLYIELEHPEKQGYGVSFGNELIISPVYHQVLLNGTYVKLTRKEFDVLYFLASHPGQVFTRGQIYNHVWHNDTDYNVDESVKSCIKSLRKKLVSASKDYIQNVHGVGYRFVK